MRRATAALAAGLLIAGAASACTGEDAKPTTGTATGPVRTIAPIVYEGGAADLGIKWNWNLKPPLAYAEQVGWGETFFEVEWCALRAKPDNQRFAQVERLVGQAQQMGYRMMLKIRVGNCAGGPEQLDPAEGTRKSPSTFPDDPAAYQQFVTTLVNRYKDRGVTLWAIENEVDANNFWSGTPQEYVDLVALASSAIKAADPSATILDAGISSTGHGIALAGELLDAGQEQEALALYQAWFARRHGSGTARFPVVNSVEELRTLLQEGRATRVRAMESANWQAINSGAVTAYQLHFYENPDLLHTLLDYVRRHLAVQIPLQGWEIGTAWPGGDYTEAAHGAEVARLLGTLLTEKVSPIVYLPLAYTPGGATKVEIFRGLVSPEGADLPSGQIYQRYAEALRGSTSITEVSVPGGSGVVILGGGANLAVIWPASGKTLTIAGSEAVRSAADPSAGPPNGSVSDPVLIAPGDTDLNGAIAAITRVTGGPVTPAG
ncbi:MAG: hypothetical protein LCH77_15910 [Actinobacteria bacterium]|nr:hypothetical protein [Actinomycetota bacterium]